jgi:hypothetical protein
MQLQISFKYFIIINNNYTKNKSSDFEIISYQYAQ